MRRSKRHNEILLEKRLQFRRMFSDELDIRVCGRVFPEWVYAYREPMLDKVSNPVKMLARLLKDCGVSFKIKFPLEIDGRWKFADIYIPESDVVVTVGSKSESMLPSLFGDEKAEFFSQEHRVCSLNYDVFEGDHEKVLELIEMAS